MKRLIRTILLASLLCGNAFAHSGKPKYNVVIDTDGAIDDMRAISMLLSGNDIRVLAITCSQGTLLPDSVYVKVNSLLSAFHHEGIPVGVSEGIPFELPDWEPFAQNIRWAWSTVPSEPDQAGRSSGVLNSALESRQEKVIMIALGSLKTYADWFRENPGSTGKIERIIWYNDRNITKGFNYQLAPEDYEFIRQSGILLEVVSGSSEERGINEEYLDQIRNTHSVYASRIEEVHSQPQVAERIRNNQLKLWDDQVPLYLTAPILFEVEKEGNIRYAAIDPKIPADFIYETIGKLLLSANYTNNRVFIEFPVDTVLYKTDYARMVNETILKYGLIEWKAICMTNEIHGHTGIYSIIGAKMGIRAMEFFNVGVNNLKTVTFAGNTPPLSCFNDGIQISTGATIGQGLITISDTLSTTPSAVFEFNNQKVMISLDTAIAQQVRKEIKYGVDNYGLLSDRYWIYIEGLAIRYWTDFNRYDILVIEKL